MRLTLAAHPTLPHLSASRWEHCRCWLQLWGLCTHRHVDCSRTRFPAPSPGHFAAMRLVRAAREVLPGNASANSQDIFVRRCPCLPVLMCVCVTVTTADVCSCSISADSTSQRSIRHLIRMNNGINVSHGSACSVAARPPVTPSVHLCWLAGWLPCEQECLALVRFKGSSQHTDLYRLLGCRVLFGLAKDIEVAHVRDCISLALVRPLIATARSSLSETLIATPCPRSWRNCPCRGCWQTSAVRGRCRKSPRPRLCRFKSLRCSFPASLQRYRHTR